MLKPSRVVDAACPQNDATEFTQLWSLHAGFVARVLRRFGVADGDVADASQEVFLVVLRRLPEFEGRAAHRTWLYRICACVASDYRKRAHRRYERSFEPALEASVGQEQEAQAANQELLARVENALAGLSDEQRQVFVLYDLEELSMPEIAALIGCPLKTAFSRLYAARREVRSQLRRSGYASVPLAVFALEPWKAQALAGSGAIVPLAPQAWAGAALAGVVSQGSALLSAAAVLTVAAIGIVPLVPGEGATLVYAEPAPAHAPARTPAYRLTPRATPVQVEARPRPPRQRTHPSRSSPMPMPMPMPVPGNAPAATAPIPQRPSPAAWIRAPEPEPPRPRAAHEPAVGLDEVLSATSIHDLLRFAPQGPPTRPVALVPALRPRAHGASAERSAK